MTKNYISIYNGVNTYNSKVYSNVEFFKNTAEVIIQYVESLSKLIFTVPTLDYRGTSYKVASANKTYLLKGQVINLPYKLPNGKYFIDKDESTEDKLVIYIN